MFQTSPKTKVICIKAFRPRRPTIRSVTIDEMFFYEEYFKNIHKTIANEWRALYYIKIVHERL